LGKVGSKTSRLHPGIFILSAGATAGGLEKRQGAKKAEKGEEVGDHHPG